ITVPPSRAGSFDHPVGAGGDSERHLDAEGSGSPEGDHELELARLHDRQGGWLLALENASDIDAGETIRGHKVGTIAGEAARFRELAPLVDRRQPVTGGERHDLLAPAEEERIGGDQ